MLSKSDMGSVLLSRQMAHAQMTGGACPNDWCNNELETDVDGKTQLCYELVKLDES